jgi:hypothetical protein
MRVLSSAETSNFLAIHPFTPDEIPSYGLNETYGSIDYLIGVNHNTGEIKVMDITAYDTSGTRINPSLEDEGKIQLLWDSTVAAIPDIISQGTSAVAGVGSNISDTINKLFSGLPLIASNLSIAANLLIYGAVAVVLYLLYTKGKGLMR